MRIIDGTGSKRRAFNIVGATKCAMGRTIHAARDERIAVGKTLKSILFPSQGAYHKAKRRGERAVNGMVPA